MHYSLLVEALLITSGLSSPLRPRQQTVTVHELFTDSVTGTRTWNHDRWADYAGLPSAGLMTRELNTYSVIIDSATAASPTVTASDGSGSVPSESSTSSNVPTTQQAPSSPVASAVVPMSAVTATSPPTGTITSKGTSSATATGEQSPKGDGTIFPSASPISVPPSGQTVYATSLPVTPSVGPGGNPTAPSATTQTYVDKCQSPSAALPPLATPTDDSLADWFLYYHNIHRRNHSAPDMTWSMELEKDAATLFGEYATQGKKGHILGINGDSYGQNIAGAQSWSSGSAATYKDYVVSNQQAANSSAAIWYHEGDNLSAAQIAANQTIGHFKQMVSKVSTLLGCAVSQSGYISANGYQSGFSVACNYGNNKLQDSPVTSGLCHPQVDP